MNDTDSGRRRLLKSLTVGGAATITAKSLPTEWKKPVVDSVLLPAHAQTSVIFIPDFHGGMAMNRVNGVTDLSAPEQIFKSIIDSVIPEAQACVCRSVEVVIQQCCTKPVTSGNQSINLQVAYLIQRDVDGEGVNIEHWGAQAVPVDGSTVVLSRLTGACLGIEATISIDQIGARSKGTISMKTLVSSWTADYDIPRGNLPLPAPQCGVPA
ncbi:MAG: hypothetical protein ACR2QW_18200 [bacterium]